MIGIIGGSGIYDIEGLTDIKWKAISSPFGTPSDALLYGKLNGQQLVFLPRHGRGHKLSPGEINYRANIDALKRAGVTDILSVSAVGSLKESLKPGTFVIVDQYIDRTVQRERSFFGKGCVAHVSMAYPTCRRLSHLIHEVSRQAGIETVPGGTYLAMEGPQFSTHAESEMYRSWNCDVIGMTNIPEAKLAREAEMCYASIAMVTDYDCWHPEHDQVTVQQIIRILTENASKAQKLVKEVVLPVDSDSSASSCSCRFALENAIITSPENRDPDKIRQLDAVAGRVLKKG
ncbi:S-methyl-5'-thioadenosine phosphorylase [Oxalobacter paraformigenes]|uniref:S-methyl-5'-thioadenosine phosphorylase n=1 Tax=Oxalobacter paraformigenes TaxID=556268 RepID=C3X5J1_9BURK|nr:S-methyl-5'-thioadenosine phosphorylase [Oxalobacter paraformigenes]EEO28477.1 methylthioadenosine phosphorylase [Oxalobacter paraformigenes]